MQGSPARVLASPAAFVGIHRQETNRMRWRVFVVVVGLVGAIAVTRMHAGAGNTAQKCRNAKLKAVGRAIAGQMACYAKAKKSSAGVRAGCLVEQQGTARAAVDKAGTSCPGTAAAIEGAVDSCVGALVGDDPGNGRCPAASARAIGRAGRIEVRCEGKVSSGACATAEDDTIPAVLARAGGCVDARAIIADSHACNRLVGDVVGRLPTTSTTLVPPSVVCCAHPAAPACKYVTSTDNCLAESGEPS